MIPSAELGPSAARRQSVDHPPNLCAIERSGIVIVSARFESVEPGRFIGTSTHHDNRGRWALIADRPDLLDVESTDDYRVAMLRRIDAFVAGAGRLSGEMRVGPAEGSRDFVGKICFDFENHDIHGGRVGHRALRPHPIKLGNVS